jgi:hypothetical protein
MAKDKRTLIDAVRGTPVDRAAALVTSRGPATFDAVGNLPAHNRHSAMPLPMRTPDAGLVGTANDIRGFRNGRLVVVGLLAQRSQNRRKTKKGRKKMAQWVVRCDCGCYEIRSAKAMRSPINKEDRCAECWRLADIQRRKVHRSGLPMRERWEY